MGTEDETLLSLTNTEDMGSPMISDVNIGMTQLVDVEGHPGVDMEQPGPSLEAPVASQTTETPLEGNRIVNVLYFLEQLNKLADHTSRFGCSFSNLKPVGEARCGLISHFLFKCNMCGFDGRVENVPRQVGTLNLNTAAVVGITNIGGGFTQLESFTSSLSIPPMSSKLYAHSQEIASSAWETAAHKTFEEAAKEEAEIALANNNVDENGVPLITVVCDGSWAKRSYRGAGNYNSLSGTAAIVGYNTRKILYLGVKNKYCLVCQRAAHKEAAPKEHTCYKNHAGSSQSMEADIIAEGFCNSLSMYNLIFNKMIADGDSSCHKKILERHPYQTVIVQKIECRNHLLRNYCNKLRAVTQNTRFPKHLRNEVENNIGRARGAIKHAIKYRREGNIAQTERIVGLRKDILNSLSHVFGEHKDCATLQYFCKKEHPDVKNVMAQFQLHSMDEDLLAAVRHLARHAASLIEDVDSNTVEQFNSLIAKYTGGKRVNYTQRSSYRTRCFVAAVSRNTNRPLSTIHKHLNNGISPGKSLKKIELRTSRKNRLAKVKKVKRKLMYESGDKDYGENCQKPDLDDAAMAEPTAEKIAKTRGTV